jgi:hypothetical protein
MKMAGAGIVATAFPNLQHIIYGSGGQSFYRGKGLQKAQKIRPNRFDLSLLQEDFTDPDRVRILRVPPGKITKVIMIPADKFFDSS